MDDLLRERDFNRLVLAFREMESSIQFRKAALKIALNETKWGAWEKTGITEDALEVVRQNIAMGDDHLFRDLQAAHIVPRDEYCHRLLSEDMDNPYQYMREVAQCVLATKAENNSKLRGWDHMSRIYPVDPDMFGHGASNVAKKTHPSFPAFMALVKMQQEDDLMSDKPKMLGKSEDVEARLAQLEELHIAPLTEFVQRLRLKAGDERIPYFDPWDGGVNADILFLLEAPGPNAKVFVSRNNPDETAKNIFDLTREAGIDRKRCVNWNVVPWACLKPDGTNRNPTNVEVAEGVKSLSDLLILLPRVRKVVLMGLKAQRAEQHIRTLRPDLNIYRTRHPSPLSLNRFPSNRAELLTALMNVNAQHISGNL